MKVGYRLSPNEESQLLQAERERRRKLRLLQVLHAFYMGAIILCRHCCFAAVSGDWAKASTCCLQVSLSWKLEAYIIEKCRHTDRLHIYIIGSDHNTP